MCDKEYYRQKLAKMRERLSKEIKTLENQLTQSQGDSLEELTTYDNHPADIGSETFQRSKDIGLLDNSRLLLREVEVALQRIEDGAYGTCENCGQKISQGRLLTIPYTTLCRTCKGKQEKRETLSFGRPVEEEVFSTSYGDTLQGEEGVVFDGEDSYQAVARYNKQPNVYYEDIGEDEDEIGLVEDIEKISNRDYKRQL